MAKITLPKAKIQIAIPDLILGNSKLKRKATLYSFTYDQLNQNLSLAWKIEFFETLADGSYGVLIEKQGINSYVKNVEANNTIMVEVATGNELYPSEVITTDAQGVETKTMVYDESIAYTGQYDWFNALAEGQPIEIHNMIRLYGSKTNWN